MVAMTEFVEKENSSFADLAVNRDYAAAVRRSDDIDRAAFLSRGERATVVELCGSIAHVLGYNIGMPSARRGSLGRLPYGRMPVRLGAAFALRRLRARIVD
jgi:hypothetical protein